MAKNYVHEAKKKRILERYEPLFKYIKVRIKSLKQNKYVFNDENKTEYEVYEKSGLFSKKYVFEQTSY